MGDRGQGNGDHEKALAEDRPAEWSFDGPEAKVVPILPFSRYAAAARGDLPFEIYFDEMLGYVRAELEQEQLWARRPEPRFDFHTRHDS